jgi:dienelactone hydrolase
MVTDRGQAKIMDFGLAKVMGAEQLTRESVTIGTVTYMSPEQAQGDDLDKRTDIWSFGVVLYELLTGQLPFRGDRESIILHSIVGAEPKPVRLIKPDVPAELQRIVDRALKKRREDRYASAADVADDLRGYLETRRAEEAGFFNLKSLARRMKRPAYFLPAAVVLIVLGISVRYFIRHNAQVRWARLTAIPEVTKLIDQEKWSAAFDLARQAEFIIPKDPVLLGLWPQMSTEVTIETNPAGASVLYKEYQEPGGDWKKLGVSPIRGSRVPDGFFRWRTEKAGYAPVDWAAWPSPNAEMIRLDPADSLPPGMIRVMGGKHIPRTPSLTRMAVIELDDFLIDKYEVTNAQFKEFVDQVGYQKPEFWKIPFKQNGRAVTRENAIGRFKDRTGRPGPAVWELGTYPEGQGNYPVSGISWYEAAAYAEFAGKTLPSVYHWTYAAGFAQASFIMPESNFAGKGPSAVGSHPGMSPFGTFDMAGNVREWCWNDDGSGRRYLMGGGWEDEPYVFAVWAARDPFDRSAGNGFRCVKPAAAANLPEMQLSPVAFPPPRDYSQEKPASDELFIAFKGIYSYDKTNLAPKIESTEASAPHWIKERISFNAAYGNERMAAYLFLPKAGKPPYQTVVYFPGGNVLGLRSSSNIAPQDFILISGRAFLYPVYKSTYERGDGFTLLSEQSTINQSRDHHIMWYKDFARSIDYLETREDIDHDKLAFTGISLGAEMGNILLALDKRIKAGILVCGGFLPYSEFRAAPEVDFFNFAPRVVCPTLMLNGRYDNLLPVETMQNPMFELLGTPAADKSHLLYDTGHFVPRNEWIKETLDWLDRYLGPVE